MKILFTTNGNGWDSTVDERFGRSMGFLIYEEDTNEFEYFVNTINQEAAHGAGLQAAKSVLEINPDIIITGNGPGEKAYNLIKTSDIKIFTGCGNMTIRSAYEAFKEKKLELFN